MFIREAGLGGGNKTVNKPTNTSSAFNQATYTAPKTTVTKKPVYVPQTSPNYKYQYPTSSSTTSSSSHGGISGKFGTTSKTPQGSVSQAVVAGRADPVPQSNVNTKNNYYTITDGNNRTAIDAVTGNKVGSASGTKNPITVTPPNILDDYYNNTNNNDSSSSANYYDTSYLDAIRRLLQEQRDAQEKAANERYLALLGQYSDSYDSTRNAINLNNAYAKRWLNQMYGGENSGAGLSNQASLMSSMNNSLYNAKKAYEQNKANALANKYDEMANATNNYANNYNNYVLQPYSDLTKQAIANDDQSFLKYLQKLGY